MREGDLPPSTSSPAELRTALYELALTGHVTPLAAPVDPALNWNKVWNLALGFVVGFEQDNSRLQIGTGIRVWTGVL